MSGDGVICVWLPRGRSASVFALLPRGQGWTIHSAVRGLISAVPSPPMGDLKSLKEPPDEIDTPRFFFCVGWRCIDLLAGISRDGLAYKFKHSAPLLTWIARYQRWKLEIAHSTTKKCIATNVCLIFENGRHALS